MPGSDPGGKRQCLRSLFRRPPALLVAPVTDQGATTRSIYLPAGSEWYNFWINERVHGGQRLTVQAPIDTIRVFVRAGSILPLGAPVRSTNEKQAIEKIRIYPGASAHFALYVDDGTTYAYEHAILTDGNNEESNSLLVRVCGNSGDIPS